MRNKIDLKRSWFCLLFSLLLFSACEQELDKYYEVPGWLKGNAKEILEKRRNFSIFLKAVEKIGYDDMISGKGIITVMAPTDEVFKEWLDDNSYSSIDAVPIDELEKLITFHLIYYSFDKSMFANYRPEGVYNEKENAAETAGLHYKFRTKSKQPITTHNDHTIAPGEPASEKKVYHYDRFIPVFSSNIFNTKGIDAEYNYKYFYPSSAWAVQDGGFSVSNASVSEYAIIADNGYVYVVDKVIEPLETVYNELVSAGNYSTFLTMYDRFVYFVKDDAATTDYGNGSDLYVYYHLDLPLIGSEWPVPSASGGLNYLPNYANLELLSRRAYNVFAPDNAAIQNFFDSYWAENYASIDKVPFIPIKYLLDNHVYEGDVVFPQDITSGKIMTNYGTAIEFDPEETGLRKICNNGTLYGLENVMKPRMFESVTAPLFKNPDYQSFLFMMDRANIIPSLMTSNVDLTFFIPTYETLIENTTIDGNGLIYVNINPNRYGSEDIQIESDEGYSSLGTSWHSLIANNHVAAGLVSSVGTNKIYKTQNAFQYLWVDEAEQKVYSSSIYNNSSNKAPTYNKIYDAYNGETYELSGEDAMVLLPDNNLFKDQITKNTPADFVAFRQQLTKAGLHSTAPPFNFLVGSRFIALIPTKAALDAGKSKIPTSKAALIEFLKYFFVNVNSSSMSGYPFPGAGIQGEVNTFRYDGMTPAKLRIVDTGTGLQVIDSKGNVANVLSVFPNIYSDGAAYLIDGLLEFE